MKIKKYLAVIEDPSFIHLQQKKFIDKRMFNEKTDTCPQMPSRVHQTAILYPRIQIERKTTPFETNSACKYPFTALVLYLIVDKISTYSLNRKRETWFN